MKESEIADAVAAWLGEQGYEIHGEVQVSRGGPRFDVVAIDADPEPIVVECKAAYSTDVRYQANRATFYTRRVWVAVGTNPRAGAKPEGPWGILRVTDAIRILRRPDENRGDRIYPGALRRACNRFTLHRRGGVPVGGRGTVPTPFRVRAWEIADRIRGRGPLAIGQVLDISRDLFQAEKHPRAALSRVLADHLFVHGPEGWEPSA